MSKTIDSGTNDTLTALLVANVLMGLLLVAFATGLIYVESVDQPAPSSEVTARYTAEAKERFSQHAEAIEQEMMALASEAVPPITDAVYEQARRDFPKYVNVLEREGETLLTSIEKMFVSQVRAQVHDYLQVHRDVLQQEFPSYANPENVDRVMQEFEDTFNRIVERYYLDEFRREAETTQSLWAAIEPMPMPGPNEPSLQEQLADYSSDWTMLALEEPDDYEPTADGPQP